MDPEPRIKPVPPLPEDGAQAEAPEAGARQALPATVPRATAAPPGVPARGPQALAGNESAGKATQASQSAERIDLVRRLRAGEPEAPEQFVRSFEVRVLRLAMHMLGNRSDAEDVAQEAFLRLLRNVERFHPDRDPGGWVTRVTLNLCFDHLKWRRRQAEEPLSRADMFAPSPDEPAAAAQQSELRQILRDSLRLLTPRERAVFILHEVEGEAVAVIGRSLRLSRITVRRHLSRARRRLRTHLESTRPELL